MKATKADLAKQIDAGLPWHSIKDDAIKEARRQRRIKWANDSARASARSLNWMDDSRDDKSIVR